MMMWWLWRKKNTEKCSGAGKGKIIEMWWQLCWKETIKFKEERNN